MDWWNSPLIGIAILAFWLGLMTLILWWINERTIRQVRETTEKTLLQIRHTTKETLRQMRETTENSLQENLAPNGGARVRGPRDDTIGSK